MSDQLPTLDPPMHTAHRGLLMRLITPKRLKENEEFMWRLADRTIDEFVDRGHVRVRQRVRGPVRDAGGRRSARRARGGPRDVPRRARAATGTHARQHRRRRDGAQPAGVPVPAVHRVRRGPAPRAARRRADRPRHRDVPRRLDARGHRRRAHRREPVRGGPGDDRAPPRDRAPAHGRAARPPAAAPRRARPHPELRRGGAALREPDQGRLPLVARRRPRSAASTSPPARR